MTLDSSIIAPFQTGLDNDTESWMSPTDSFSIAENVHIFDGFIEKRSGYRKFGSLSQESAYINVTAITNGANGLVTTAVDHGFANDDYVIFRSAVGMTQVNNVYFKITVTALNQFELNVDTTLYGVYGGGASVTKLVPVVDRVMGISQFVLPTGNHETIVFGTLKAHRYDNTFKKFLPLDQADIMSSSETDYVWSTNLQSSAIINRLYFTNGKQLSGGKDGIRYYDGSGTGNQTVSFAPALGGGRFLYGAKLLFCLRERLLAIGTYEFDGVNTTFYPQRLRWSQAQAPSNWNDLTPGGGGYSDAPTGDHIITGRALQDAIIAFFTQSVWTIQVLTDPALPFKWIKANDFRAADGKMASIGYDKYVVALGIRGITASDGGDTERIDNRIKEYVSNHINVDQFGKVFGLRSFAERRTWILYPETEEDENSAALIFDEDSEAFTTYKISMNCLGYGNFSVDYTLADFIADNDLDITIEEGGEETIADYLWQAKQETLLGGDISGNIYTMELQNSDDGASIVASMTTAGWNPYQDSGIQAFLSYVDIYVDTDKKTIALVDFFKDDETAPYASQYIDFLPNLNFVSTIEAITNDVLGLVVASDHGLTTGDEVYIYGASGMDEINEGPYEITVVSNDSFTVDVDTTGFGVYTGNGSVYTRKFYKTKTWKRAYAGGVGYLHRMRITSSGTDTPFRISGFKPSFKPRGKRMVN